MFYSKSTKGFYLYEVHGENMPEDKVEISDTYHHELLEGQSTGLMITANEAGYPVLVERSEPTLEEYSWYVRHQRNDLLKNSDWTQLPDIPPSTKESWAAYRQLLRDVTEQSGFPTNVQWPEAPQ
jgi:hypothetical protein